MYKSLAYLEPAVNARDGQLRALEQVYFLAIELVVVVEARECSHKPVTEVRGVGTGANSLLLLKSSSLFGDRLAKTNAPKSSIFRSSSF